MAIERRWLRVSEAGAYLALHPKSVYRACRNRRIPYSKAAGIGIRIDLRELDAMLVRLGISPEKFGKSLRSEK